MAKKKKKVNLHAQQKLQAAQYKKQYLERLHNLCNIIGNGEPLYELLPHKILTVIYQNRGVTPKLRVAKGSKITKRFIKIMYCHLENEMKEKYIDLHIPNVTQQVNLVDYYQILLPFEAILQAEYCTFPGRDRFNTYCATMETRYSQYIKAFIYIIYCACYYYCDLSKRGLYTFTYDICRQWSPVIEQYYGFLYQVITLELYPLDVRYVNINGERRPVVQTGEIRYTDNVSTLDPTTVQLKRLIKGQTGEVPVYVQQHAVERTMERACCIFPGCVPSFIHKAFTNKRRIIQEGERYLVECWSDDIKIGYFVGRYIDNIFVILTFLLITNSSTPEGRKLSKLTGLQKEDIKYLAIDDLKTLVNSDITGNWEMRQLFIEAGCESILQINIDLRRYGEYAWLKDESKQGTELSKMISEYIQLGANDEEYFENE
jgi:hypothetical protein